MVQGRLGKRLLVTLVLLAGLGGVALAAESRFDDIDDDLMRGMDDAVKDLEPALSAGNIESATADAEILRDGLKWTHDYFTGKGGVDDGVKIAADGQSLVVELQKHLADKNVDAAVTAARQTSKNCRSCHDIYKP